MTWDEDDRRRARQMYAREWAYILSHGTCPDTPGYEDALLYVMAYDLHRIAEGREGPCPSRPA